MTPGDTPASVTSRADVTTHSPARYAKTLVSHLGRKLDFTADGPASIARIGAGTGQVVVGVLTLHAAGPDEESIAVIEHVLGSHLQRFATREELTVSWTRTPARATPP